MTINEIETKLNGAFNVTLQSWIFLPNVTNFPSLTLPVGGININTLEAQDFASGTTDTGFMFGSIQERGRYNL
jgi:hypothetical protein